MHKYKHKIESLRSDGNLRRKNGARRVGMAKKWGLHAEVGWANASWGFIPEAPSLQISLMACHRSISGRVTDDSPDSKRQMS